MTTAIHNFREKGFTLIELLVVVAIIGILAAIAIPGYLGLQERSRKGAVIRAASAGESELQIWLHSALAGRTSGAGVQGRMIEVDSSGDGIINSSDVNNSQLGVDLGVADQLCSRFVNAKQNLNREMSPWVNIGGSLWVAGGTYGGRITCSHGAGSTSLTVAARDSTGLTIYSKVIYSD